MTLPVAPGQSLPWALGLRNHEGLYVTVEPFGNRINVNSKIMKTKQTFVIEQPDGPGSTVAIRTHLKKYVSAGADGSLKCDAEAVGPNEKFELKSNGDGRSYFVSTFGYFLGGRGDHMDCYGREIQDDRLFYFNLAVSCTSMSRVVPRFAKTSTYVDSSPTEHLEHKPQDLHALKG
jgi:fascin 1/2